MSGRGGDRTETFTVPEGRRAVVRHFAVVLWTVAGQSAFLFVHGVPVFYLRNPAPDAMYFEEVRFTAYAGETVRVTCAGSDISYAVDGFLFTDAGDGRPDDADNVISSYKRPTPLPAAV